LENIGTTRSKTGFRCRAWLDTKAYPMGLKVRMDKQVRVRLRRRRVLPRWNFATLPHDHSREKATYF
jgi:hypothetical protein